MQTSELTAELMSNADQTHPASFPGHTDVKGEEKMVSGLRGVPADLKTVYMKLGGWHVLWWFD